MFNENIKLFFCILINTCSKYRIMDKIKSILQSKKYASIFLFLISFLIFIPSLKNDFVWDDIIYVKQEIEILKNFSPDLSFFIPEQRENKKSGYFGIWRPILYSSWAFDAKVWGSSPFGFHLTNIIFHSFSTVLLFLLCHLILKQFNIKEALKISGFAALIFAVHPVHVETVSFISARSDLLCSIFILLSMIFFVLTYKRFYYILISLPFFYLALLSKETAIVLPFLVLSFALIKDYKNKTLSRISLAFIGIFMLVLVLYYITRARRYSVIPEFVDTHFIGSKIFSYDLINYLNYIFISATYYVNKLIYPFDFNVFVGKLDYNISNVLVSYVLILLLFSFVIISLKRKNYLIFYFLSWIVITLLPAIGVSIVNLTTSPFSERFIYIPSIGYCILASLLVFKLIDFQKNRKIKYVIISFVLAVFSIFTLKQQFVWRNSSTLWAAAVKRSPGYVSPHLNYGHALLENGKLDEALNQFLIALDPDTQGRDIERVNAANNMGNLYIRKQEFDLAEKYFKKAFDLDKKYEATYYYHMGLIYYIKGNSVYFNDSKAVDSFYNDAIHNLLKSLKIAPNYGRLNLLLSEVYLKLSERTKAIDYAKKSLQGGGKGILDDQMRTRANEIINLSE